MASSSPTKLNGHAPPLHDIRIHIVGAGMGGMGSALSLARQGFTNITVWEQALYLDEVGAGINIPPNCGRILSRWGVMGICKAEGVAIERANVIDCETDEIISSAGYSQHMIHDYGFPFITVHRAALQKSLVRGALDTGRVQLITDQVITEYDFDNTRLRVRDNDTDEMEWVDADVIIAADGIKSQARQAMYSKINKVDEVEDSGQAAYRIMVKKSAVQGDAELLKLFSSKQSFRWIGENRHVMGYPINAGELFNISTSQPDGHFVAAESWTALGNKSDMLATFSDFPERVQRLLAAVPEHQVLEWRLREHKPLPVWVTGNIALLGDACHPTLPHLAQGAAQALEDAVALGIVLSRIKKKEHIHPALMVYQKLRKPRTDWAVSMAAANSLALHQDRNTREAALQAVREGLAGDDGEAVVDKLASRELHDKLFKYDIALEAEQHFSQMLTEELMGAVSLA
ncbi:hypothetical protein CspeluHIS016_0200080 [Cutaneotrichosporon spelunceum]|uniref:FAD-binding domain-containing protein n=1 Tax=Cutaneotrichosporon spelunceum TaxID=1672016 RepID=A0AAD3YAK4_9TREE|nr:hypothetical protein CspeluHIS016_0200080 [Cutaneotrichosporon spelunceum]